MDLRYDGDFLEGIIFLCAIGGRKGIPPLQILRFHREREKLYAVSDPQERDDAFFRLHLEWFREWGLEKSLRGVLAEFPLLLNHLNVLAFRKARGKSDEGADLYVNAESGRNGVVALRVERFETEEELVPFLYHEFMHLQDMVDPSFGYERPADLSGRAVSHQRLMRERFRVLWDATIDGRLQHRNRASVATRAQRRAEFERAYSFWPADQRRAVFDALWADPSPKHAQLLAFAADPRDVPAGHQSLPGSPCPLCGFPTFDWADCRTLSDHLRASIQAQFPDWTIQQSACRRCLEVLSNTTQFDAV